MTLTKTMEIDVAATTTLKTIVEDYFSNLEQDEGWVTKVTAIRTRKNGKLDIATKHN